MFGTAPSAGATPGTGIAVTVTDPFGTHVLPGLAGKPAEELHVGGTRHPPYQTPVAQTKK